jgi:hypothetical protein
VGVARFQSKESFKKRITPRLKVAEIAKFTDAIIEINAEMARDLEEIVEGTENIIRFPGGASSLEGGRPPQPEN